MPGRIIVNSCFSTSHTSTLRQQEEGRELDGMGKKAKRERQGGKFFNCLFFLPQKSKTIVVGRISRNDP